MLTVLSIGMPGTTHVTTCLPPAGTFDEDDTSLGMSIEFNCDPELRLKMAELFVTSRMRWFSAGKEHYCARRQRESR